MTKLILTCEHGGNKVPAEYKSLFKNSKELLKTHRGYDIGALELFAKLKPLADFHSYTETSRLLIELNRSFHHKNLFSSITKHLAIKGKNEIINNYYLPYRNNIENKIDDLIKKNDKIVHLSIHTFTPVLNNKIRNCDIGLLYNPKHRYEKNFCITLKENIQSLNSFLNVRFNYPYLGIADGFTSYLRKRFNEGNYLGIEIEVNQKFPLGSKTQWKEIVSTIYKAIQNTI